MNSVSVVDFPSYLSIKYDGTVAIVSSTVADDDIV